MSDFPNLCYYTDFDTFKLILEHGTLRFKESTKSNDKLDTNILYAELKELFNERYGADNSKSSQMQFLIGFFENTGYQNNSVPVVACFTEKDDSRLLWDAYTMHRADRKAERYNGVCIKFNEERIYNAMQKECDEEDIFLVSNIKYNKEARREYLNVCLDKFDREVEELSKDPNQSQDIIPERTIMFPSGRRKIAYKLKKCIVYPMMRFLQNLQLTSSLFKHEFWKEEMEIRALFSKRVDKLNVLSDGAHYYDVHITNDCIDKIILGPEFTDSDLADLKRQNNIIDVDLLRLDKSVGTGVITSDN